MSSVTELLDVRARRRQAPNREPGELAPVRAFPAAAVSHLAAVAGGSPSARALSETQRTLGGSPRVAQLKALSARIQRKYSGSATPVEPDDHALQLMPAGPLVVQREEWDDDTDDDDDGELSELEQDYAPPPRATLWDFIEPVLTPAVKKAEERARALKEEADRLEAEAQARRDAEAEAQAREQQRIAAEQLEQARQAAELQAQAEALAKQQAEAEAQKKAAEALKLTKAPKSKLGPNRASSSSNPSNVNTSVPKKKKNRGVPMALGLANVGGYLGRQNIANHPTFVLNLFYTLNNNPSYNQIHVHLDAQGTVVHVSLKYTGQQGNGQHVANTSALFAEAAQRAATDR